MPRNEVSWLIGGTAGEGLESGGESFASALAAAGYAPTTQRDFPSRIRGGDTTFTVRLTPEGFLCPPSRVDLALAFNDTVLPRIDAKLGSESLLLVDEKRVKPVELDSGATLEPFPFTRIAKEVGMERAKNMVALGASAALMDIPLPPIQDAVAKRFASKGDTVVENNTNALQAGHAHASFDAPRFQAPPPQEGAAMFLSGNEAASLGALAAGCRIAAAYPITPASDVLEFLTPRLRQLGGVALQMEDEMAALNLVVGSGFAGAKGLTATSGPGLSLMSETIGMAGSTETPCVILDCQRPGPSTGMPTKHAQEDLWHMIHGGHGEFVRIVLAPTDVADACAITSEAFRLAERFRCPTFVALDQQLCLFKQTVAPLDLQGEATAHEPRPPNTHQAGDNAWDGTVTPYGEPTRPPIPGEAGIWYSNSTEHAPSGFTNEDPQIRNAMVERRQERLRTITQEVRNPVHVEEHGDPDAILVSWGSTVDACREAARRLRQDGTGARVVAIRMLWPIARNRIGRALHGKGKIHIVEANATGQLARLLRSEFMIHDRSHSILRYDGSPITSSDILDGLQQRGTSTTRPGREVQA